MVFGQMQHSITITALHNVTFSSQEQTCAVVMLSGMHPVLL